MLWDELLIWIFTDIFNLSSSITLLEIKARNESILRGCDVPNVGVSVTDPDDPFRYLSVSRTVDDVTEEGAVEHVHHIAQRFMDTEEYPHLDEEPNPREIIRIRPEQVRAVNEPERED